MDDQWESCYAKGMSLEIFTPKTAKCISNKDFIKEHQEQDTGSTDQREVICLLLSDGWEPYTANGDWYYFRRKYKG